MWVHLCIGFSSNKVGATCQMRVDQRQVQRFEVLVLIWFWYYGCIPMSAWSIFLFLMYSLHMLYCLYTSSLFCHLTLFCKLILDLSFFTFDWDTWFIYQCMTLHTFVIGLKFFFSLSVTSLFLVKSWLRDESRCLNLG